MLLPVHARDQNRCEVSASAFTPAAPARSREQGEQGEPKAASAHPCSPCSHLPTVCSRQQDQNLIVDEGTQKVGIKVRQLVPRVLLLEPVLVVLVSCKSFFFRPLLISPSSFHLLSFPHHKHQHLMLVRTFSVIIPTCMRRDKSKKPTVIITRRWLWLTLVSCDACTMYGGGTPQAGPRLFLGMWPCGTRLRSAPSQPGPPADSAP